MDDVVQLLLTYSRAVWRYRWYSVALAWLICLIGWAVVVILPNEYKSNAKVYVDTQSLLRPLLSGLAVQADVRTQIDLMSKTLLTRPNLEKLIRMTDMDIKLKSPEESAELIDELQKQITFERDRSGLDIYFVSYAAEDPKTAKNVVQGLLTIFMESSIGENRKTSDVATQFIDQQIKEYELKLTDTENRIKEFKQRNVGLMPGGGDYFAALQQASTELQSAENEYQEAKHRRDEYKRQLLMQADEDIDPRTQVDTMPVIEDMNTIYDARIQEMESKIDGLLLRYTEHHPEVLSARRVLGDLKTQREAELKRKAKGYSNKQAAGGRSVANPVQQLIKMSLASEEANLASLSVRVRQARQKAASLKANVNAGPEIETELTALTRDYDIFKQNYNELVSRRESAKLGQDVDTAGEKVSFRVIEPPIEPLTPTGPNRPLFVSIILLLGLAAAVAIAIVLALLRPTFYSARSVIEATHLPVLGEIGLFMSPEQQRKKKFEKIAVFVMFGGLCALYGILMILHQMYGNLHDFLPFSI